MAKYTNSSTGPTEFQHGNLAPPEVISAGAGEIKASVAVMVSCLWEPADILEIRLHHPKLDGAKQSWHIADELPDAAASKDAINLAGWNAYVGGNPRVKRGGAKNADVPIARSLFVDLDHIELAEAKRRWELAGIPQPSLVIASGHGIHAYWRLRTAFINSDEWRAAQKRMIVALDSDTMIHDPARIMRLPGFLNVKSTPHVLCKILSADPTRTYNLASVLPAETNGHVLKMQDASNGTIGPFRSHDRKSALAALDSLQPARADKYDEWLTVGMSLHAADPSATMMNAWDQWSRQSDKYRNGQCARKWDSFGQERGRTVGTLIHMAKADSNGEPQSATRYTVGPLEIIPIRPRRMTTKDIVQVGIFHDGEEIDTVQLTSTSSGRTNVAKVIKPLLGEKAKDHADVAPLIGRILVDVRKSLDRWKSTDGATIKSILAEHVPGIIKLTHRGSAGKAYSESFGEEISRSQFVEAMVTDKILDMAAAGTDAPRLDDGTLSESAHVTMVEKMLRVVWANTVGGLSHTDDGEIISGPPADFQQAIGRCWSRRLAHGFVRHDKIDPSTGEDRSVQLTANESLAVKARGLLWDKTGKKIRRDVWLPVVTGMAAWCRTWGTGDDWRPVLAMRLPLFDQANVRLEMVKTNRAFALMGQDLGLFEKEPEMPVRIGQQRITLSVLDARLSGELLAEAEPLPTTG